MFNREIYVVGAARTAIGTFGGSLKDVALTRLGTIAVRAALERSGVDPARVGHVVMGNVVPTEPQDAYLSRVAAVDSGIPVEVPAFNVNRLCGSGLQAIISAGQSILLGDADVAIGGGAESMSRGPYITPSARWGARMGDVQMIDYMNGILHDPWKKIHMGITAENVAQALETIDHNDPVVFNFPAGDSVYFFPDRTWTIEDFRYGAIQESSPGYDALIRAGKKKLITRPVDKKDHYIKRCIGLPGDSLEVRDRQVFINGEKAKNPEFMQFLYQVKAPNGLNSKALERMGLSPGDTIKNRDLPVDVWLLFLSGKEKEALLATDNSLRIEHVVFGLFDRNPYKLFPHDPKNFQPALAAGEVGNFPSHFGNGQVEPAQADEALRANDVGDDVDGQHALDHTGASRVLPSRAGQPA